MSRPTADDWPRGILRKIERLRTPACFALAVERRKAEGSLRVSATADFGPGRTSRESTKVITNILQGEDNRRTTCCRRGVCDRGSSRKQRPSPPASCTSFPFATHRGGEVFSASAEPLCIFSSKRKPNSDPFFNPSSRCFTRVCKSLGGSLRRRKLLGGRRGERSIRVAANETPDSSSNTAPDVIDRFSGIVGADKLCTSLMVDRSVWRSNVLATPIFSGTE